VIIIYDFVLYKQPDVIQLLKQLYHVRKPKLRKFERLQIKIWCDDDEFDFYKGIMEEQPRPGKERTFKIQGGA